MRTTLSIDEELFDEARRRAEVAGITVSELVDEALRTAFDLTPPRASAASADTTSGPPVAGGQPKPGA